MLYEIRTIAGSIGLKMPTWPVLVLEKPLVHRASSSSAKGRLVFQRYFLDTETEGVIAAFCRGGEGCDSQS